MAGIGTGARHGLVQGAHASSGPLCGLLAMTLPRCPLPLPVIAGSDRQSIP